MRTKVLILYGFFFLMGAETYVVNPLIPTLGRALDVSAPTAAMSVTAFVIAYAVSAPLVAAVATPLRRPRLVAAGTILFAVGNVACGAAWHFDVVLVGRLVAGVGAGLAAPSVWTLLSALVPANLRGRIVGYGVAAYGGGQVLGVPLGAFIAEWASWRLAFIGIGVGFIALLPPLIVLLRTHDEQADAVGDVTGSKDTRSNGTRLRGAVAITLIFALAATFFVQAGRLGAYSYVSTIAEERFSVTTNGQGLIGLAAGLGAIAGSVLAGWLCDRLHRSGRSVLYASILLGTIFLGFAIVSLGTHSQTLFLITLVGWCTAGGGFYSSQQVFFSSQRVEIRQSAIAWNGTVMNIGIAAGTTILGIFTLGGTQFITAMSVLAALGLVALVATLVRTERRRDPAPLTPTSIEETVS